MQPLSRILMASALALTGSAALAQSAPPATPAPSAPDGDLIGPPQLSNFSLGGKVTQPAPQQPAAEIPPVAQPARATRTRQAADVTNPAAPLVSTKPSRMETASRLTDRRSAEPTVQPSAEANTLQKFITPVPQPQSPALAAPAAATVHPAVGAEPGGLSSLLWLLAAAAAAGAAGWYFLWQRPRARLAPAGVVSAFDSPVAEPALPPVPVAPPAAAPREAPPPAAPSQPKPLGVVSTRLRPWIELQLTPGRVIVDDEKVVLEFEMALFNSGSAPARDILVEGALFNAGPAQDQQIAAFFENPIGQGNRLQLLAPLQRLAIPSAVTLAQAQLIPLEIEGRSLLVPMAAFNALYRWGSGSNGQTSASYLVGKETNGAKLAPFRLDLGPRVFRKLAAREHELRVRK